MRTEKEIKEAIKIFNDLETLNALVPSAKVSRDMLLWVLGKNFKFKTKKK